MIIIKDKYSDVLIGIFKNQKVMCDDVGLPYHSVRNKQWVNECKEYQNYFMERISFGLLNDKYIMR